MGKKNSDKPYMYWRRWVVRAPMILIVSIVCLIVCLIVIVGEGISRFGEMLSSIGKTLSSIESNAFLRARLESFILWVFKD